jgi:hypothetical protein
MADAKAALEAGAGPLQIHLECPQCGAPVVASDEIVSLPCSHCASRLLLAAPERDEMYVARPQVATAADAVEVVLGYRIEARRHELLGQQREEAGPSAPALLVDAMVAAYAALLRGGTRLLESHRLHVPYWHLTGSIVQSLLGREHDGPKLARLRAFAVEHTVPAYDTEQVSLRDHGLRLSRSAVAPLRAREVQEGAPFLPWAPVAERSYREIERWRGQDLDERLETVAKHGEYLFPRRSLIYRPYWLLRLKVEGEEQLVLVDGSFATIAGHPQEDEWHALQRLAIDDPLGADTPSYRLVHVVASRCPDCGAEAAFDPRDLLTPCPTCHLALQPEPTGLRIVPYAHAFADQEDLDATYLPFWTFPFRVAIDGGAPATRLEEYTHRLFPAALPPGFAPVGERLWVPAFRLLGTESGDEAFRHLAEWIHAAHLEVRTGKVPIGGEARLQGASVPEADARALGRYVLFGLHGKASAARLNTLLMQRGIMGAGLELGPAALVMVAFRREGADLVAGTLRLPAHLAEGGETVSAARVTVHAAAARRASAHEPEA